MSELRLQSEPWSDKVDFAYIASRTESGGKRVGQPLTLVDIDKNDMIEVPTFSLTRDECQDLTERLWDAGFKSKHDNTNSLGEQTAFLKRIITYLTRNTDE